MKKEPKNTKIFLTIFPYWDPMIPPMGITSLKQYIQQYGYNVITEDLIVKKECLDFYTEYFRILGRNIPYEKQGNFRNIGHDVLAALLRPGLLVIDSEDLGGAMFEISARTGELPNGTLLDNADGIAYAKAYRAR